MASMPPAPCASGKVNQRGSLSLLSMTCSVRNVSFQGAQVRRIRRITYCFFKKFGKYSMLVIKYRSEAWKKGFLVSTSNSWDHPNFNLFRSNTNSATLYIARHSAKKEKSL